MNSTSLLAFLLATAPAANLAPQQAARSSIEGIVLSAETGRPLAGAQVVLTGLQATPFGAAGPAGPAGTSGTPAALPPLPAPQPSGVSMNYPAIGEPVLTGDNGAFLFRNLNPGTYRVFSIANGYVRQEYGQRVFNGAGTQINLSEGQTFRDAVIRLARAGAVSGRILNELGQPAQGVPVQLLRATFSPQGRTFQSVGQTSTDDRGEYRIYGITPGNYYLNAGMAPGATARPVGQAGNVNAVAGSIYGYTFFPGVRDIAQSSPLEIRPGSEVGANLMVTRQSTYRVRGRLIDSQTGRPPSNATVSLGYRSLTSGTGSLAGRNYDPATGNFELQNVPPGDYVLQAETQINFRAEDVSPDGADPSARNAALANRPAGQIPLRVAQGDVEGLVLVLNPGISVAGRVIMEPQGPTAPRIQLRPFLDGMPNPPGPSPQLLRADAGAFLVGGIREFQYQATVSGLPQGYYVKSVQHAGQDMLGAPVALSNSAWIEVTVRQGAGQVSGTVADLRAQPLSGVQVALIPEQRNRADLYAVRVTDQNGRFTFTGVSPGEYKVFSWEAAEQGSYFDPEFLKRHEQQGQAVRVREASGESIEVRVIPAQ